MEHCCKVMEYYATEKNSLLEYEPYTRSYDFILYNDPRGSHQILNYCPWCGKKLPEKLNEEWCEMVEKEMGLESFLDINWSDIPDKYKTDEWWKKRGL